MLNKSSIRILILFIITIVILPGSVLWAQDSRFRGTVKDEEGNPIPKARITLTLIARNLSFSFETNKKGKFYRRGIEPGEYLLTVEVKGYQPFKQQIYIQVGQEYSLDIVIAKEVSFIEARNRFEQGVQFYQSGKFDQAIEAFKDVLAKKPDFVEGYYNLGMAYLRQGDPDAAIKALEKAIELKPDFMEAYFGLGQVYIEKGEPEKAAEIYKKGIDINPKEAKIYVNLAILHFSNNQDDLAMEALFKARELDPSFPNTYYQLGLLYLRKQEIENSIDNFEKFLELAPQAPEAESVKSVLENLRKKENLSPDWS